MTNKTYKSKLLAFALGLAMCLTLMFGVIFASGTVVPPPPPLMRQRPEQAKTIR